MTDDGYDLRSKDPRAQKLSPKEDTLSESDIDSTFNPKHKSSSLLVDPITASLNKNTEELLTEVGRRLQKELNKPEVKSVDVTTDFPINKIDTNSENEILQEQTIEMSTNNETNVANATIAEAKVIERAAVLPKFEPPQKFNAATDNPVKFMRKYETCTETNRWTSAHKIMFFGSYLEGLAQEWYKQYLEVPENNVKHWDEVKNYFLSEFGDESPVRDSRRLLIQRRQRPTEGIKNYLCEILELCMEVDPKMPFDNIRDHFENGLHEIYQEKYIVLSNAKMNLQDLKAIVGKLQKIHLKAIQKEVNKQSANLMTLDIRDKKPEKKTYYPQPNQNKTYFNPSNSKFGNNRNSFSNYQRPNNFQTYRRTNFNPNSQNANQNSYKNYNNQPVKFQPRPGASQARNNTFQNTRTRTGQIICFNCNKAGHHYRSCQQ